MQHLPVEQPAAAHYASAPPKPCTWYHHGYKHAAGKHCTKEDTLDGNPALYFYSREEYAAVHALEAQTVATPDCRAGEIPDKVQYLRAMGAAIGWDDGEDATLSYVECSGGSTRWYHGRPMSEKNRLAGVIRGRARGER